jgi:hypothetical protein
MPQNLIKLDDLEQHLPEELASLLDERDGAARLVGRLPKHFSPQEVQTRGPDRPQRVWELVGLYYRNKGRLHDALPIFSRLYDHMLLAQKETGKRVHKAMPLVWVSDCYLHIGFLAHAKRYMMLTLCEDVISDHGQVDPDKGCYFRLVWRYGLADAEVKRYAKTCGRKSRRTLTSE